MYLDQIDQQNLPVSNPNVKAVIGTLDGAGGVRDFPAQEDADALAGLIQAAIAGNELVDQDSTETDPGVSALIDEVWNALHDLTVSLEFGPTKSAIREIIDRYTDADGAGYRGVTTKPLEADTAVASRAIQALDDCLKDLNAGQDRDTILGQLQQQVIGLRTELSFAQGGQYPRVEPWLAALVADLDAAVEQASPNQAPQSDKPIDLAELLKPLQTQASNPPADPARLDRNLGSAFSPSVPGQVAGSQYSAADVSTQLLINFDPRLKTSLYPALANLSVSSLIAPTTAQALRVKAAPFGATAPLRIAPPGNATGGGEWPLSSATISVELPSVPASLSGAATVHIKVSVTRAGLVDPGEGDFPTGTSTLNLKETSVQVVVGATSPPLTISLTLTNTGPARTVGQVFETITLTFTTPAFTATFQDGLELAVNPSQLHDVATLSSQQISADYLSAGGMGGVAGLSITDIIPEPLSSSEWNILTLDGVYDQIVPEGWVVIQRADKSNELALQVRQVLAATTVAVAEYGMTGKATRLTLDANWLDPDDSDLSAYRNATVYAQSETLSMADEPYDADVRGDVIELDGLYDGLKSGRWVIVSGERTDIPSTGGVQASELGMIQSVAQSYDPTIPGDKLHSYIFLSNPLSYSYQRTSVTIFGNVAKATNGTSQSEVLGSGDGTQSLQSFVLKQSPLTFVSSPTARGIDSTLGVSANGVTWKEADTLAQLGPRDRKYVTQTDNTGKVSVIFGDGVFARGCPPDRRTSRPSIATASARRATLMPARSAC